MEKSLGEEFKHVGRKVVGELAEDMIVDIRPKK